MKATTRRQFLTSAMVGGIAAAHLPLMSYASGSKTPFTNDELKARFDKLDKALKQPVFKKELFPAPVIIKTLELLEYNNSYLCRVRSEDGAEGISVAHSTMSTLYPVFLNSVQSFFIGQDARNLDLLLEKVFIYKFNYRFNGLAMGIPLATIEFAILDMMGKIANKPLAELIGKIHNPEIGLYVATEYRELPLEEHFDRVKAEVGQYDVNALKIRVGFQVEGTKDIHYSGIPGKSEKLIPMIRKYYGDKWSIFADANGYYDADEAIRIGRILEEYKYGFFEEPVMFYHFEDIKKVADTLTIPISNGEQDQSFYNFRWLLAHDGIDIVEPDTYYFGGFIRSMRVALMAQAVGKSCITHMSGGGLGFLYNSLFVSALPNATPYQEFKGFGTQVPYECRTSPLKIVKGMMKAPTGPGLGVTIDPEFVAKHRAVRK